MDKKDFLEYMKNASYIELGSEIFLEFHNLSDEARKITTEINNKYHTQKELAELFSKLTNKKVDESFRLFPPFYTDCGINITLGKNVFINSCCKFQDQGGITIGDNCLIGHNVTIATLNHDIDPDKRANMYPKPVKIGNNVWIGSDTTILPGVTIGDNSVIGAKSLVVKNIPENVIAIGSPCRQIKEIKRKYED